MRKEHGHISVSIDLTFIVFHRQLSDFDIPGEDEDFKYPSNLASPQQILIDASNGASDYGNKFGEPLIQVRRLLRRTGRSTSHYRMSVSNRSMHISRAMILPQGYCRTFGQRLPNKERREWLKPIMFRWDRTLYQWVCLRSAYALTPLTPNPCSKTASSDVC
jgi:hypothetical protein